MRPHRSKPVRILHIFGQMNRGGAEMRTMDVMRVVDGERFRMDFCAVHGKPGELDDQIKELGGSVHLLRLGPFFPIQFIRLLKRERYDVVHSHVLLVSGMILTLAWIAGVPIRIAHFRSTGSGKNLGGVRNVRDRVLRDLIDRTATKILAVSAGAMEANWSKYKPLDRRCEVVYSGIDTRAFEELDSRSSIRRSLGIEDETPVFVHVGRFADAKNHERLIGIFERVREALPSAVLLLVGGGGPIEAEVKSKVSERHLREAVYFLGVRRDIPDLLGASDVMIFPSLREGLPGVLLEAVAAGLPVVASNVPGALEIAKHFDLIHPVSLDRPDTEWTEDILRVLEVSRDGSSYPTGRAAFLGTEFDLAVSKAVLEKIWQDEESQRTSLIK